MSGSHPPSPSNSPQINIAPTPDSTTSRTTYRSSNIPLEEQRPQHNQPVASSSTTSLSYDPPTHTQVPQSTTSLKRPPSQQLEEESSKMAKRLRRSSPAVKEESPQRMTPSSDSQDADNEHDDDKGKRPEHHPPEAAPTKKKRTRTLTTPHQAAVLHALLAQSRFPTTAMREEVGRSIGLSARKVQIWFQNQRQKARRPRKEPDESAPLPPRYGPFPAYAPQSHSTTFPVVPGPGASPNPQLVPTTYNAPVQQPYTGRPQHSPEGHSSNQPAEAQGRLLGPGVPGADVYGSSYRGQSRGPWDTAPSQDINAPSGTPYSSDPSSQVYSPRSGLQPPAVPRSAAPASMYDQTFNRTLPPLSFDSGRTPARGANVPRGPQPHSPFITLPPPEPSRPRIRSSVSPQVPHFVPQSADVHGHSRVVLPPPFTLQPEPHWDDLSFSTTLRPAAFSRSRTESLTTRGSSASPIAHWRESSVVRQDSQVHVSETPPVPGPSTPAPTSVSTPAPSIRSGRYDPVRATFVPYSATSTSPIPSPCSQKNLGDDQDDAQATSREGS